MLAAGGWLLAKASRRPRGASRPTQFQPAPDADGCQRLPRARLPASAPLTGPICRMSKDRRTPLAASSDQARLAMSHRWTGCPIAALCRRLIRSQANGQERSNP